MKVLRNTKAPPTWNRQGFGFRELRGPAFRATANHVSRAGEFIARLCDGPRSSAQAGRLNSAFHESGLTPGRLQPTLLEDQPRDALRRGDAACTSFGEGNLHKQVKQPSVHIEDSQSADLSTREMDVRDQASVVAHQAPGCVCVLTREAQPEAPEA